MGWGPPRPLLALTEKGKKSLVIFHLIASTLNDTEGFSTQKTTNRSIAQFQQRAELWEKDEK